MRYDVVLVGFRLNARIKPAQALQTVLGLDAEACKTLSQRFPATILTGASQSHADQVVEQLNELGGKAEVHLSRISLANEPEKDSHSVRPFAAEEASGGYAIGEILAPMAKLDAGLASKEEATATNKRASRAQLDQALRDSFRPNAEEMAAAKARGGEHDLAFAGLQNFDDSLDGFDNKGPTLEVEPIALRSIQRRADPVPGRGVKRQLTLRQRLVKFLRRMLSTSFDWSMGLLSLGVVVAVTLYAVGYALDPAHAISALRLEQLPESMREATGKLLGK